MNFTKEEKCVLAKELGHHWTGSNTNPVSANYRERLNISKIEYKANKWAIEKLIPFNDFIAAIEKGIINTWELAEYFCVTDDFYS